MNVLKWTLVPSNGGEKNPQTKTTMLKTSIENCQANRQSEQHKSWSKKKSVTWHAETVSQMEMKWKGKSMVLCIPSSVQEGQSLVKSPHFVRYTWYSPWVCNLSGYLHHWRQPLPLAGFLKCLLFLQPCSWLHTVQGTQQAPGDSLSRLHFGVCLMFSSILPS